MALRSYIAVATAAATPVQRSTREAVPGLILGPTVPWLIQAALQRQKLNPSEVDLARMDRFVVVQVEQRTARDRSSASMTEESGSRMIDAVGFRGFRKT